MLDKILYVSSNEVVLYYAHKPPLRITSDEGDALELAHWLFKCPVVASFAEYKLRKLAQTENTCPAISTAA